MAEVRTLGQLLDALRRQKRLTVAELARGAGVNYRTLVKYLRDERTLDLEAAVPLFWLVEWDVARVSQAAGLFATGQSLDPDNIQLPRTGAVALSEPFVITPRHARNLPFEVRKYLAEFRLRLTNAHVPDEEIEEALELMQSPQLFTFYKGGVPSEYNEEEVLRGMKAIGEGVVIPELRERGRKIP